MQDWQLKILELTKNDKTKLKLGIMTIEQLMDRAEELNKYSDGIKIQVEVDDFENMDDAIKLCEQQDGSIFEPNGCSKYLWCSFFLGDVDFIVRGETMTEKEIKNYYINQF